MSDSVEYSFADEIFLDVHALDYEASKQGGMYKKYSELWANACFLRDSAKQDLEERKAEAYVDILLNYVDYGFTSKPADNAIKNLVAIQDGVKAAEREYIDSVQDANRAFGLREAWVHKKEQIGNCSRLHTTGYFSETKIPKEVQDSISTGTTKELSDRIGEHPRLMKLKEKRKNGESK